MKDRLAQQVRRVEVTDPLAARPCHFSDAFGVPLPGLRAVPAVIGPAHRRVAPRVITSRIAGD